jgi:hypothetical protein
MCQISKQAWRIVAIAPDTARFMFHEIEEPRPESAFYYARVIKIPTPRWIVYDAFRYNVKIPEDTQTVHQERAYTSPIWDTPQS